MHATRKVKLKDLTLNLTCNLCRGYFVDATTIIECLHSFCRSCIVQHLKKSEYCPVCDVQLHTSKPLTSIRSDQMLQEIVYKLVPGLFQSEMMKRRKFYKEHPNLLPINQVDSGHTNESYITSDDIIHLSLEYYTTDVIFRETTKRYVKCPAAVSIAMLKKLIHGKYDLNNSVHIDVMYGDRILPDDFLLMDIAYKYSWTQNGSKPLQLSYRVKGTFIEPKIKLFTNATKSKTKLRTRFPAQVSIKNSAQYIPKKKVNGLTNNNNNSIDYDYFPKVKSQVYSDAKLSNGSIPKRKNSKTWAGVPDSTLDVNSKVTLTKVPGNRKRKLKDSISNSNRTCPKSPKQAKYETNNNNNHVDEMLITNSAGNEVQLRISENGVISATTTSLNLSGQDSPIPIPLKLSKKSISVPVNSEHFDTSRLESDVNRIKIQTKLQKDLVGSHKPANYATCQNGTDSKLVICTDENQLELLQRKLDPTAKIKNGCKSSLDKKTKSKPSIKSAKTKSQNFGIIPDQQNISSNGPVRFSMSSGNGSHFQNDKNYEHSPKKLACSNPIKRFHNISSVNGDLKFTTSPAKNYPSSISTTLTIPGEIENAPNNSPSMKPPKFFKSRVAHQTDDYCSTHHNLNGHNNHNFDSMSPTLNSTVTDIFVNSSNSMSLSPTSGNDNEAGNCSTSETSSVTGSAKVPTPLLNSYNSTATTAQQLYRFPATMLAGSCWPADFVRMGFTTNTAAAAGINRADISMNLAPYITNNFCSMPFYGTGMNLNFAAISQQQQLHRNNAESTMCSTTEQDPMSLLSPNQCHQAHHQNNLYQHHLNGQDPNSNSSQDNNNCATLDLSAHNRNYGPPTVHQLWSNYGTVNSDGKNSSRGSNVNSPKKISGNSDQVANILAMQKVGSQSPTKKAKVMENGESPTRIYKKRSPSTTPRKKIKDQSPTTILQIPSVAMSVVISPKTDLIGVEQKLSPAIAVAISEFSINHSILEINDKLMLNNNTISDNANNIIANDSGSICTKSDIEVVVKPNSSEEPLESVTSSSQAKIAAIAVNSLDPDLFISIPAKPEPELPSPTLNTISNTLDTQPIPMIADMTRNSPLKVPLVVDIASDHKDQVLNHNNTAIANSNELNPDVNDVGTCEMTSDQLSLKNLLLSETENFNK